MPIAVIGGAQQVAELTKGLKKLGGQKSFQNVLQQSATQQANQTQGPQQLPGQMPGMTNTTKIPSPLKSMLNSISKGHATMDNLMKEAMSGKQMSPGKLLVLQSSVYAYSSNIEAASKIVETATNAVKTTMQTQV